jgi:alkanesulfonate monooxygenase SsuD/methylene tetrahydromethanopterin reductase-like flavin-dependent oxidoreductase (luciferase family)
VHLFDIGLTDHLEGPRDQPSAVIFDELAALVGLADRLGVRYAWFSEHHDHAHEGHLPTPLLFALHLAGQTRDIRLGTAIICLNLHHPLDVAEQVAVADLLTKGRMAVGFGSGSTPEEFRLFGLAETEDHERHARFEEALRLIRSAWTGIVPEAGTDGSSRYYSVPPHRPLPVPAGDLAGRSWVAVNSLGSARIAGSFNFNMLFSHLRTPEQYRQYSAAYRAAGGTQLIAANRPVFVGPDDQSAFDRAEPALRTLWRRFQGEGKVPAATPEPTRPEDLCAHPINFIVGGPESVARQLRELHEQTPFDVANVEVRWAGLSPELVHDSLRRLMDEVIPLLQQDQSGLVTTNKQNLSCIRKVDGLAK